MGLLKNPNVVYTLLILFYVVLTILEMWRKDYYKALYFVGAIVITVALMKM